MKVRLWSWLLRHDLCFCSLAHRVLGDRTPVWLSDRAALLCWRVDDWVFPW